MPNTSAKNLEQTIKSKLKEVLDPELGVSIIDLGLIYNITVNADGVCKITMTLTTIGCPLFGQIQKEIEDKVMEIEEISEVETDLTFDPPWDASKMTLEAKIQLGLD